jgi:hypothetical protein
MATHLIITMHPHMHYQHDMTQGQEMFLDMQLH